MKMLKISTGSFDFSVYYDCREEAPVEELFYDCREPPELRHPISDAGDICPTTRTTPCMHIWRTMKTMRIPVMQSNRYANWMRCHWCGHTHAMIAYSATCCLTSKEKYIEIVDEYKRQRHMEWHQQPKQPPIDAVDACGSVHGQNWDCWFLSFCSK